MQNFALKGPVQIYFCFALKKKHFPLFVAGQAKPSVSSHGDDSFVTPQKSRKSKKPVITFSSDEEEDEEGEWLNTAATS